MHQQERGAVSLFVVIFATLLITIVTVGFLRLMVQNQQQASNLDLSQSAYDSAQAGVQDAERALLAYETCVANAQSSCSDPTNWNQCNNLITTQLSGSNAPLPEIPIQTTNSQDAAQNLNQAYTCVKVALDTDNVVGNVNPTGQYIVPLQGVSGFTNVEVDWFTQADLGTSNNYKLTLQSPATSPLPLLQTYNTTTKQGWQPNTPSVLRVQLMQLSQYNSTTNSGGFKLSDFDDADGSGNSDANTVFLYPTGFSGSNAAVTPLTLPFAIDARRVPIGQPQPANCVGDLSGGGYACSEILTLPTQIGGGDRVSYLRITPMYNASHFQVKLLNSTNPNDTVQFHNVQPSIDSTGRANDLFRRIVTRVDLLNQNLPYPTDAVDVTGGFCKDFAVTNDASQYQAINSSSTCKP